MIYSDIKTIFSPMTTHQQNQLKSKNSKRTVPLHKIMGTMLLRHITTLHNRLNQSKLHQSHSLLQCQNLNRPQCQSQSIRNQLSTRSFLNQIQSRSRNRSRKKPNQFQNQKWYNKKNQNQFRLNQSQPQLKFQSNRPKRKSLNRSQSNSLMLQ